jgi:hypothetical protein
VTVGQVGVGQVGVGQVACRSSGVSVKWLVGQVAVGQVAVDQVSATRSRDQPRSEAIIMNPQKLLKLKLFLQFLNLFGKTLNLYLG